MTPRYWVHIDAPVQDVADALVRLHGAPVGTRAEVLPLPGVPQCLSLPIPRVRGRAAVYPYTWHWELGVAAPRSGLSRVAHPVALALVGHFGGILVTDGAPSALGTRHAAPVPLAVLWAEDGPDWDARQAHAARVRPLRRDRTPAP